MSGTVPTPGALSGKPVFDVEARIEDLADAGPALATWLSVRGRDLDAARQILRLFSRHEITESAATLLIGLLRMAGHHHAEDHLAEVDAVSSEDLLAHGSHLSRAGRVSSTPSLPCLPGLDGACGVAAHRSDECAPCSCDVEQAARLMLASPVSTSCVAAPLQQIEAKFRVYRSRPVLTLKGVAFEQMLYAVEAAAVLMARRYRVDVERTSGVDTENQQDSADGRSVVDAVRARILSDQASRLVA